MRPRLLFAVLLAAAGCREPGSGGDAGARSNGSVAQSPSSASAACEELTRRQCLDATRCRLTGHGPLYVCRSASGACEEGFPQSDKAACERHAGCEFRPGNCYCPCMNNGATRAGDADGEGCACACGGGPPPSCVAKGTPPDTRPSR
jgi:hypothetical protein